MSIRGSIRPAWEILKSRVWKVYFGNVKATNWRRLGAARRCALLDRCISPLVLRATSAWPPQHVISCEMDSLQRKVYGCALGIRIDEGESPAEFQRKRNTAVRAYCERHHWWSRRWFQQALKWDSHLARDWQHQMKFYHEGVDAGTCQTNFSFVPLLRQWHDDDWILAHTTFRLRNDGRMDRETGLRRVRGSVSKRWQEGVEHASRMCQ